MDDEFTEAKMLELIRWMEEDLCFLLPGVILANRYLAPDARRSVLFKHLRSQNRGKALRGIRNQAWDLTLVYAWMNDSRGSDTTDRIVILASLDRGLHSIARLVLIAAENEDLIQAARQQKLEDEFVLAWGECRGRRLLKALLSAESRRISNPESKRLSVGSRSCNQLRALSPLRLWGAIGHKTRPDGFA
jgi:hypothetical protein